MMTTKRIFLGLCLLTLSSCDRPKTTGRSVEGHSTSFSSIVLRTNGLSRLPREELIRTVAALETALKKEEENLGTLLSQAEGVDSLDSVHGTIKKKQFVVNALRARVEEITKILLKKEGAEYQPSVK